MSCCYEQDYAPFGVSYPEVQLKEDSRTRAIVSPLFTSLHNDELPMNI